MVMHIFLHINIYIEDTHKNPNTYSWREKQFEVDDVWTELIINV